MKISEVTREDGVALAVLLNTLKVATFEKVSGKDIEAIQASKKWIAELAREAAAQLSPAPKPDAGGMKIKSMGPLPGKLKVTKPSKKKK